MIYLLEKMVLIEIRPLGVLPTVMAIKINYGLKIMVRGKNFVRVLTKLALNPLWRFALMLALIFESIDSDPLTDFSGYTVFAVK